MRQAQVLLRPQPAAARSARQANTQTDVEARPAVVYQGDLLADAAADAPIDAQFTAILDTREQKLAAVTAQPGETAFADTTPWRRSTANNQSSTKLRLDRNAQSTRMAEWLPRRFGRPRVERTACLQLPKRQSPR